MSTFAETKRNLAELKNHHNELYQHMVIVFNEVDPCQFFKIGRKDEYDIEISVILACLEVLTLKSIRETTIRVFLEWLGFEFKNEKQLDELAEKILEVVQCYV